MQPLRILYPSPNSILPFPQYKKLTPEKKPGAKKETFLNRKDYQCNRNWKTNDRFVLSKLIFFITFARRRQNLLK